MEQVVPESGILSNFCEWFSINPPFPDGIFGDEKLVKGAYINGGIFPLVGGELAKAAFDHGYEKYADDILRRYYNMIEEKNETFLWYFPDGRPSTIETSTSPDATPTDGWGSSAMLYAFIEGLIGIEDRLKQFKRVKFSPRWLAAGIRDAMVRVSYAVSGIDFNYEFNFKNNAVKLEMKNLDSDIQFHIMIPENMEATEVYVDNAHTEFENEMIESSRYVNFNTWVKGSSSILINLIKD